MVQLYKEHIGIIAIDMFVKYDRCLRILRCHGDAKLFVNSSMIIGTSKQVPVLCHVIVAIQYWQCFYCFTNLLLVSFEVGTSQGVSCFVVSNSQLGHLAFICYCIRENDVGRIVALGKRRKMLIA